jgi:hypothetical protein
MEKLTDLLLFIGFSNLAFFEKPVFMYCSYVIIIKNFDDIRIDNNKIGIYLKLNQKDAIEFLNIEFLYEIRKSKIKQLLTDDS